MVDLSPYITILEKLSFPKVEEFMTNDCNPNIKRPSGASFTQCIWIIESEAYSNSKWFQGNMLPFIMREVEQVEIQEQINMKRPSVSEIQKAINMGDIKALILMGDMLRVGRLVDKDPVAAFKAYKRSAERNIDAIYKVGLCYDLGIGVEKNYKLSVEYLQRASDNDLPDAQYKLAWQYEKGNGVTEDLAKSFKLLQKAALCGHIYAQYNLAVYYEEQGREWFDPQLAVEWYKKAAAQGHSRAQNNLGYQYHNGRGVQKDYGMAYYWYLTAADQGHDCGQYNVGFMWHHGHGVKKNIKVAIDWYRKAADQGYLSAQKLLGLLYSKGAEIPPNYSMAVHYFLLASEKDEGAKDFLEKPDNRAFLNIYFSQFWPKFHPKLLDEIKQSIMELYLVLLTQAVLPRELWNLIVKDVIALWPVAVHKPLRRKI